MIKDGKGGANTNKTGLEYENKWNFKDVLKKLNYSLVATVFKNIYEVYDQNQTMKGFIGEKPNKSFYSFFNDYLSKKFDENITLEVERGRLFPDKFYFDIVNQKLHIIELKVQNVSGSTDEKLQTAPYKKFFYEKLFDDHKINVKMIYVWNEWFNHERYDLVKHFLDINDIKYYLNEIDLSDLEL